MTNNNKTPAIRFKGFTDAWEQRKLSDLFEERNEQAPMDEEYPLMAFIANIGVAPKGDRYDRSALVHDEKGKKYKRTEKGDFIYSSNNLETGSIGLNNYGNACISPVYSIFKSKHTVDPEFMGRILLRKEFINQMVSFRQGVVYGQWKIHEDDFLNLDILVPQTTEQQKIGGFFSELDKIITLHQHKYDKLIQFKVAMLQKMFPQNGANKPEIRFKEFTDAWEQRKVGETYNVTRGYVLAAPKTSPIKTDDKPFPVYSSQTKDNGLMGYYNEYLYENAITWTTDGANAGTVNFRAGKFYCTNVCGVLLSDAGYSNKAAAEALNMVAWKWVSHVGNPKLMNNVMAEIEISLPPTLQEQDKISEFLESLDSLITLHQRKCDKYKNIKAGLIRKLFPVK